MATSQHMKAALIHEFGGIEKVEIDEVAIPYPSENQIQIAVSFAGVNPIDWKICDGYLKTRMKHEFPIILGWDVAGVVSAKGKKVKKFKEGDPIFAYCRKDVVHDGTFAEFVCIDANQAVKKPKSLSFAEASAVPLATLAAWQSLFDQAHIQPHENVLIHAGAGGVGGFAIQLAKLADARVITTASKDNFDYVKKLGADEVIDYKKVNFVDGVHDMYPDGVDVVFDTVGRQTLSASYNAAKKGGRLVTIAGVVDQTLASQKEIEAAFIFVAPNQSELQEIADLFDSKKLIPPKLHEIPLDSVQKALYQSQAGHTQGKIVLKII